MDKHNTHLVGIAFGGRNGISFDVKDREFGILNLSDCTTTAEDCIKQSDVIERIKSDLGLTVAACDISYIGATSELSTEESWGLVAHHTYFVRMCVGDAPKPINI